MEAVADVAVLVAVGSHGAIVELVGIPGKPVQSRILVPLVVIAFPGYIARQQNISDAVLGGSGNREGGVVRVVIGKGVRAVAKVSRVVIVQQLVVTRFAVGLDWRLQRTQIL
jgi:hypothetical protein